METPLLSNNVNPCKSNVPKVTDFDLFLPWACNEFNIDCEVIITRVVQETYVSAASIKKKSASRRQMVTKDKPNAVDNDTITYDFQSEKYESDENAVKITTLYDTNDKLVQIKFLKNRLIPRQIMQIIGLMVPYQKYLTSITINRGLHINTVYEIAKFLPVSNITELCLDNAFLNEAHYHILLTNGKLKHLSLARCSINDAILKTITDQLVLGYPSSTVLSALNLSTNRITDVGAKHVSYMLRTNRQLSYLNLAGNMITDEGGMRILDTLQKFPLESQECIQSMIRYRDYLDKKSELVKQITMELQVTKYSSTSKKKNTYKGKQDSQYQQPTRTKSFYDSPIHERADYIAESRLGSLEDPFLTKNIETKGGVVRCLGNNTLCYLNLAYNNLTYVSLKKLLEVLLTQNSLNRTPKGLVRVVIEGNLMPVTCKEYEEINRLLAFSPLIRPQASQTRVKSSKSYLKTP